MAIHIARFLLTFFILEKETLELYNNWVTNPGLIFVIKTCSSRKQIVIKIYWN